ncbi:MAG: acyl-ACP--UDP-N-acetylglucosamine O-acyltransferase [Rhodobacteraceae bacterium]|nr:acyl-ACP--UDP-N-acetylglucosamine O-acyltransferase [Paracoccaceae bacterium]MCY4196883.1 acyl-ACP--UDP-N-acetylglucosamine O-acyltransferase [Paracoccaceae bacterium]MCY4327012.1 acyl-ACP--UDP-N-acetylglucosamine O-acyltransferase [Paracoccaceae bacterium]
MAIAESASVHSTAIIEPGARIGDHCQIGPYCMVGANVTLRPGVHVKSHAVVTGQTEIGEDTVIFPFACVGEIPQDLKYRGENTELRIGKRNRIREGATLNLGTEGGGGLTQVGDDCLFMTGAHVGHDCKVGDRVVLANQAALGGHCVIGDDVIIGGLAGVHQYVRIGTGAIIGAVCIVRRDVIPYGLVQGKGATLDGLNLIGLRRRDEDKQSIADLQKAYRQLVDSPDPFLQSVASLGQGGPRSALVDDVIQFVNTGSGRSYLTPES